MPELSNLLRQRLGAPNSAEANGAQAHPDADTLTAYVERLLPAAERQQVLTHLSACGHCREVLALSQPELPELAAQAVIQPAPVARWRRLFTPAFGLAASVAAMAVIAVVVLQIPHNPGPQPQTAQETKAAPLSDQRADATPAAPVKAEEARAASAGEADNLARSKDRDQSSRLGFVAGAAVPAKIASATKKEAARQPGAAVAQPVLTAGLTKQDFINTGIFAANATDNVIDGQSSDDLPQAPQPQPSSLAARFNAKASGPITSFSDIPANANSNKSNVRIMTPPPPPDHFGCTACKFVEKRVRSVLRRAPGTAPAISANGLNFSAMGGQGKFSPDLQKSEPAEVAAAPEKAGAAGLERSDALTRRSMSAAAFASIDAEPAPWRVVGGKLIKSTGTSQAQTEDAYPGASFQFSFVSARGNEVWAGGTHASLIHSRNGGDSWETVKLGEAASGAISNILFSGNHIQVKTSDDQTWSSSDGGKTWLLQASQN